MQFTVGHHLYTQSAHVREHKTGLQKTPMYNSFAYLYGDGWERLKARAYYVIRVLRSSTEIGENPSGPMHTML